MVDIFLTCPNDAAGIWGDSEKDWVAKVMATDASVATAIINSAIGTLATALYAAHDVVQVVDDLCIDLESQAVLYQTLLSPHSPREKLELIENNKKRENDRRVTDTLEDLVAIVDSAKDVVEYILTTLGEGHFPTTEGLATALCSPTVVSRHMLVKDAPLGYRRTTPNGQWAGDARSCLACP